MDATGLTVSWSLLAPEITLVVIALVIFVLDFMTGIRGQKTTLGMMSVLAVITTLVVLHFSDKVGTIGHTFILDPFSILFKTVILVGTGLVIILSMHYLEKQKDIYQGEFYYLLLFAAAGGMLMVSSADLITLYIGLEILSIASYCLAGFRKQHVKSNEAALKYVILGGTSSAFILYGMSFMYGLTGTTNLLIIGQYLPQIYEQFSFLVIMSLLFMLVGFGFKISIAPFHMWAPDVYEGAPTPVTAFLAAVSKVAGFALILRVLSLGFSGIFGEWYFYIAVLSAVTMIIGNFIALNQHNVKRLMAYSSIAQAGYLLVPIAAALTWDIAFSQILFYAIAYVLVTTGAFAVITLVTEDAESEEISSFNGLYYRSPWLAFAMTVFLISLAGLPVTAGFFGKFYIFLGVMTNQMYWLAVIMAVTSIMSFYYYFKIIKQMYMRSTERDLLVVPNSIKVVVISTLIATIGLGFMPGIITEFLVGIGWMIF